MLPSNERDDLRQQEREHILFVELRDRRPFAHGALRCDQASTSPAAGPADDLGRILGRVEQDLDEILAPRGRREPHRSGGGGNVELVPLGAQHIGELMDDGDGDRLEECFIVTRGGVGARATRGGTASRLVDGSTQSSTKF